MDKDIQIVVLNGPNLNLLGTRAPEIYGTHTLADVEQLMMGMAEELGITLAFAQSNHEGDLIDLVQQAKDYADGIIINAGGYTHTSISLRDAIEAVELPTYEVHVSDIKAREDFRQKSYISDVAIGMICGKGIEGYALALKELVAHIQRT